MKDTVKYEIEQIVKMSFECGHILLDEPEDILDDLPDLTSEELKEAWDYYKELYDLGPRGFYEEFKRKFKFDPMFVEQVTY
jgi:hypothetical protein